MKYDRHFELDFQIFLIVTNEKRRVITKIINYLKIKFLKACNLIIYFNFISGQTHFKLTLS